MAQKLSAFGTLLKLSDAGATGTFTTVAGVQDIEGPEFTTDTVEVTAHDSTDAFEEHVPGIKRSGEVTFTTVYDPANVTHQSLYTVWSGRLTRGWQIIAPDTGAEMVAFLGIITRWGRSYPVNGALTADISIKPTGAATVTP